MWFECEQPFLSGERCVTSRKTAAKETSRDVFHIEFKCTFNEFTYCSIDSQLRLMP